MSEVRPPVRGQKRKIKVKRTGRFLRGILIYAGILAVIMSLVLILLWCFMASYERSLQDRAIEPYASSEGYRLLYDAAKETEENENKLSHLSLPK